jgi:hypothetical protein
LVPVWPDCLTSTPTMPLAHVLLAHTETAFVALLRLGGVILREMALDGDLRELAILQVGRLTARLYLMLAGPDLWQVDLLTWCDYSASDGCSGAAAPALGRRSDGSGHVPVTLYSSPVPLP